MRKLLLPLAIACLLVASWGPTQAADEGTLQRIEARGSIALGYREDRPPMAFRNDQGQVVGYSMDLCGVVVEGIKNALKRPDLATTLVAVTAENRFDAIQSGEIDLLCGATTKTLSRMEKVGFSELTFVTGATLMSLAETPVPGLGGLADKKVAVVDGTTTIEALKAGLERAGSNAEVVVVPTAEDGLQAVIDGKVAAFSSDQVVLIGLILTAKTDRRFAISNELFSFEPFALAFQHGDPDFQLVVDRSLADLYRGPGIDTIYQRWFARFGNEIPSLVQALYRLNATPQ